jgi:hypothetical protein
LTNNMCLSMLQMKDLDLSTASKLHHKIITHPANVELFSGIFSHYIPSLGNQIWTLVSVLLLAGLLKEISFEHIEILKNVQLLSKDDKKTFIGGIWKTIAGALASKKKDTKLLTLFSWFWDLVLISTSPPSPPPHNILFLI